jgi:cell division control protein 7
METRLADSDLSLTTTTTTTIAAAAESEKAWHLLALLLSLGRTARPAELASRCALFRVSPDFVEFLCSVPGSLLLLTGDFHVTLSPLALTTLAAFVSNSNLRSALTPRIGNRLWNDIDFLKVYSRKRKPSASLIPELAPVPKRRAICDSGAGNEDIVFFFFLKFFCWFLLVTQFV